MLFSACRLIIQINTIITSIAPSRGCYQLPIFRCTNVHLWRYASPLFRRSVDWWLHNTLITLSNACKKLFYWQKWSSLPLQCHHRQKSQRNLWHLDNHRPSVHRGSTHHLNRWQNRCFHRPRVELSTPTLSTKRRRCLNRRQRLAKNRATRGPKGWRLR